MRLTCLKVSSRAGQLTQINAHPARLPNMGKHVRKAAMLGPNTLRDELQALKVDLSRLLDTSAENILDQSKNQAEAIADQIKAALSDLGEVLSDEEAQFVRIVSQRPA